MFICYCCIGGKSPYCSMAMQGTKDERLWNFEKVKGVEITYLCIPIDKDTFLHYNHINSSKGVKYIGLHFYAQIP